MVTHSRNIVLKRRIIGQEALEKLASVHRRFAAARRDGRRVIMQNCVLAGLDFQGMCFAQAHFLGCQFTGSKLVETDFSRARLFASSFEGADLSRANFTRADLRAVAFDKAVLTQACFDQADLRMSGIISGGEGEAEDLAVQEVRTSFRKASLGSAKLRDARLQNVDFTGARLKETLLDRADMRGTRFTGAELDAVALNHARLQEADLRGASFTNMDAELTGILATPFRPIDPIRLANTLRRHEAWVASGGVRGDRADFTEHNLSGIDLSGRSLAAISFARANLKNTNLSSAVLAACDFTDTNLRGADLSGCDLRGADLTGAHLEDTCLEGARAGMLPETGMKTLFPADYVLDTAQI